MANVDDRVVAMSFEKDKFESGVNSTIGVLGRLKQALNFTGAEKGLNDLDAAGQRVNLSHIATAADNIKSHFSILGGAAAVALGGIGLKAAAVGGQVLKSMTLDPITAGFHNYETQINAVQTIMANTGLSGQKGLGQVSAALANLNTYANQTVYNFSQMAQNIGTFTAAGVKLPVATESIKGIANLAALSGSNSQQASTAMYQLSQAIAANQVKLQDWNSVVNAGMGGKVFQEALFNTAEAMGRIKNVKVGETFDQWTQAGNSFRGSLKEGWINADVLTTTLQGFTGDMSKSALVAKGFSAAQADNIIKMGETAKGAATNIKTFSQLQDALKEEVATAWGAIFTTIFGNIFQATSIFSKAHVVLENALTQPIYDLNKLLEGWVKLGGRADALDAIKQAVKDFSDILHPIAEAWRSIFPATTAQDLLSITQHIENLVKALQPGPDTITHLELTFRGLFAILDIGKTLIGDVFHVIGDLFGLLPVGGGGFLTLTANIGDWLVAIDQALKKGDLLQIFLTTLSRVIGSPAAAFHTIASAISGLFSGFDSKGSGAVSNAISSLGINLPPLGNIIGTVEKYWDKFVQTLQNAVPIFQPLIHGLSNLFASIGTFISNTLQNMNFDSILKAIDTGLLGGIFVLFKKFFAGGTLKDAFGGGILSSAKESIEGLTGALKAMETDLKANALLQIAIALGVLAASIALLSSIPADRINSSMATLTIAFGELIGAMKILDSISGGPLGAVKLAALSGGLILLAGAVGLLAISVKELSGLDWNQLEKGLTAVGILLGEIAVVIGPISRNSAGMISAGLGIIAIATGIRILAGAVADFGGMKWEEIGKGLAAVAGALVGIALASKLFPQGMITIGLGLLAMSAGIKVLADAISQLGDMKSDQMVQGLVGIAVALASIALAMHSMPPGMLVQAAGLILVAEALGNIAQAVGDFGGMSMDTIAKGILALALSLTVLGTALNLMDGALPGAAALIVAAGALALLTPAIESLGHQDIGTLVVGLLAMAAAIGVLGAASVLLEPAAPAMLALGVAMLAIGGGFALVGAGVALVGTGLSAIAVSGPIAIGVLLKAIEDFVTSVPKLVAGVVTSLLSVVTAFAKAGPQFVTAIGQILVSLANAVILAAPKIAVAFGVLVQNALKAIQDNFPALVQTGLGMLVSLLAGIQNNIAQVTDHAIGIVNTFLKTLANHLPNIVTSGAHVLSSFLTGIADNIGDVVSHAASVVAHFITGIANNISKIVSAGVNLITHFIGAVAKGEVQMLSQGISIITHFISGVASEVPKVVKSAASIIANFITSAEKAALGLVDTGAKAIIDFLNGVAAAIRKYGPQLTAAGENIASALIDGIVSGIGSLGHKVISKIESLAGAIPGAVKDLLGISSPSKVFYDIGTNIVEGLSNGIDAASSGPTNAIQNMSDSMVSSIQAVPQALSRIDLTSPTITPVLDLSQVEQNAQSIGGILSSATPDLSVTSAIAAAFTAASQPVSDTPIIDKTGGGVHFTQINNSPEALSPTDIYRQTKNQLSQLSNPGVDVGYFATSGAGK